ncbi:phosphonate metabolism protein (PhnH) [Desulfuromusa kysingii]|uniref:Phosphonate metabolism protein (PhnH) n=1 Tax=Desulfuromusa kysingii TaxID=37625 RepID=A0A1H3ZWW0_9BACT|nr:phosphonate C-P lyase system protein PhnH [Desulfuromusa kysingii]SEA28145.1 phosphonate metabolism protein (PhnH) [Desulfuromusa kysingii]
MESSPQHCLDNHACFRQLIQAMSRPGKIYQMPDAVGTTFVTSLLRLLDAIVDQQSSCHLINNNPELEDKIATKTGAQFTDPQAADFLLALSGSSQGKITVAKRGQPELPNAGATILFGVERLTAGTEKTGTKLTGPGIKDVVYPQIEGWDDADLKQLQTINVVFPLGIDSIFLDQNSRLMCIPRSTRIGDN